MNKRSIFKIITSIMVIVHLIGCSTLHPIEASPDELHYKIRHENVVSIHDWVRVITDVKEEYRFQVTAIDNQVIRGDDLVNNTEVSVPIDNIVSIETQDFNMGKTTVLVGTSLFAIFLTIIIAFAA